MLIAMDATVSLQKLYVDALIPNVVAFADGAFER